MTKVKTKRYALSVYRRRSHCKNIYINDDAQYCIKSQSRLIKLKKIFKSIVKTQRQRSKEFTKIIFIINNLYISMKSINKMFIIILF